MSRRRKNQPPPQSGAKAPAGPLRVGLVTPSLGMGGAERWNISLARCFSSRIQVTGILAWSVEDALSRDAAKVCPLYSHHRIGEFMERCDVIIAWGWEHLCTDFRGFRGRMIGVSHGAPLQSWHCTVCGKMEKYPRIELTAVSKRSLDTWREPHIGLYFPNGAETDRCTPRHGRRAVRAALGIPQRAKVAVFISRIAPEKRPELFCEAVLALPRDWYGIVAGSDIHGITARLPQSHRLRVLAAVEAPGDLLAAADVFVLPSVSEAHPIALTEAWIAGTPAVYCDWPFAEQIREDHGRDLGVVCPLDVDAAALGAAMVQAASETNKPNAEAARAVAWEHYTAAAMAARWERYLLGPAAWRDSLPAALRPAAAGAAASPAAGYAGAGH